MPSGSSTSTPTNRPMPSSASVQPCSQLAVEGELTIYRANELKQTLLSALEGTDALAIDLSGVIEIDSAGVQLLMLASAAARAAGCELRLTGHSPAVREVFELLDLARYFNDPRLAPSSIG
jgi:anti-sigma B factor antagonist